MFDNGLVIIMIIEKQITGRYVKIRSIEESDARIALDMRLDNKSRYFTKVPDDLDREIEWIKSIRSKQDDYFFMVTDLNDKPIGNVGIYEINKDKAHIGRILNFGNAIQGFEMYLLTIRFAFDKLKLKKLWGDTDIENVSAIRFTKMFGFEYDPPFKDSESNRTILICRLDEKHFEMAEKKIKQMIYR